MTHKLYLVRHAQSQANVDPTVLRDTLNADVELTRLGREQSQQMARALVNLVANETRVVLWQSPYRRALQTAEAIKAEFAARRLRLELLEKQSLYLAERQLGLLDTNGEYASTHAPELAHYRLHREQGGEFWARPPLGESPFDVCLRVDFFLKAVLPLHGRCTHILVAHDMTVRAIQMMALGLPAQAYSALSTPTNASVRLIDNGVDKGVVIDVSAA